MYIHVGKPAGSGRWSASARRAGRTAPRRAGGTERGALGCRCGWPNCGRSGWSFWLNIKLFKSAIEERVFFGELSGDHAVVFGSLGEENLFDLKHLTRFSFGDRFDAQLASDALNIFCAEAHFGSFAECADFTCRNQAFKIISLEL